MKFNFGMILSSGVKFPRINCHLGDLKYKATNKTEI